MLPEERKAIARRADEAINLRDLALLDNHPGYWQTRQIFPLLFEAFPDVSSTIEQQTVEGEWVTTRTPWYAPRSVYGSSSHGQSD